MSRNPPKKRRQPRHMNPKDPAAARSSPGRGLGRRRGGHNEGSAQAGGRTDRRQMREELRTHQMEKLEDRGTGKARTEAQNRRNPVYSEGAELLKYGTPRWARVIEAYRGHCLIKPLSTDECTAPRAALAEYYATEGKPVSGKDALDPTLPAAEHKGLAAAWPEGQYLRAGWRRVFEHYAELSRNLVCVGDCVRFVMTHEPAGTEDIAGTITDILQGERVWERVAWGGRGVQRIVSNVDQMLMVVSVAHPEFRPGLIDRFLCLADYEDLPILVAINKWDLVPGVSQDVLTATELPALTGLLAQEPGAELPPLTEEHAVIEIEEKREATDAEEEVTADIARDLEIYEAMKVPVFRVSAATGYGLAALRNALVGKITAVSGHSGVGKSSVLSRLFPGLQLRVGEVSSLHGKGKHTTTNVTWIDRRDRLPEKTVVVDSPGLRTFGLWGIRRPDLDYFFRDFRPFLGHCKMPDCSHHHEPKCAVKEAVEAGRIAARRYESFQRIYRSLPD
ncbi:MAG TPA: ribosome small subunit-dependent GTPase A [Planctomycetota bacterium]|nr:ribosome small subunit-dependent GTPase A [Planctomycetota bacterium]